jgi:hypothetical protein
LEFVLVLLGVVLWVLWGGVGWLLWVFEVMGFVGCVVRGERGER